METIKTTIESEKEPKDISQEFLTMSSSDFRSLLRSLRNELSLSIVVDWIDVATARKLKAFLESAKNGQERTAKIRASEDQYKQEPNVFSSGVEWEKV